MQALQQLRAGVQAAAPALDAAMVEMRLHVPGMGATVFAHKGKDLVGVRLHPGVPCVPCPRLPSRMQQSHGLARHETVVDEERLFDRDARVAALQLAGAIVCDALREDEILRASGRPHRIGLKKAKARYGPLKAGGLEQASRDCVAAKLLETGNFDWGHA